MANNARMIVLIVTYMCVCFVLKGDNWGLEKREMVVGCAKKGGGRRSRGRRKNRERKRIIKEITRG